MGMGCSKGQEIFSTLVRNEEFGLWMDSQRRPRSYFPKKTETALYSRARDRGRGWRWRFWKKPPTYDVKAQTTSERQKFSKRRLSLSENLRRPLFPNAMSQERWNSLVTCCFAGLSTIQKPWQCGKYFGDFSVQRFVISHPFLRIVFSSRSSWSIACEPSCRIFPFSREKRKTARSVFSLKLPSPEKDPFGRNLFEIGTLQRCIISISASSTLFSFRRT